MDVAERCKLFVRCLGCKVNLADTAGIVELLPEERFELVPDADQAELVLLSTCTVTHRADRDVRKFLGGLAARRPDLPVVVTGCAVVSTAERLSAFGNVRALIPPGDPQAVARALGAAGDRLIGQAASPFARLGRRRAFAKVQDGCDARCAYCIVPRVRGRQRSLPLAAARSLVAGLLDRGHREVVLSGIHLGRYGVDLEPAADLTGLLDALAPLFATSADQRRLRLSSIEPLEWSPALLAAVERHRFVCRHFHVPLQSGDDGVLARMGRPYRADRYAALVVELARRFPRAALGADVLVGFPGEDEAAAARTLELVARLPLAYLHVFPFSPRPGTRAAAMPEAVPAEVIRTRAARLREVGRALWRRFTRAGRGQCHRVLVERLGQGGPEGRSEHYRRVRLEGPAARQGELVEVVARRCAGDWLVAERLGGPEATCRPA